MHIWETIKAHPLATGAGVVVGIILIFVLTRSGGSSAVSGSTSPDPNLLAQIAAATNASAALQLSSDQVAMEGIGAAASTHIADTQAAAATSINGQNAGAAVSIAGINANAAITMNQSDNTAAYGIVVNNNNTALVTQANEITSQSLLQSFYTAMGIKPSAANVIGASTTNFDPTPPAPTTINVVNATPASILSQQVTQMSTRGSNR